MGSEQKRFYYFVIGASYALNVLQMRRVHKLLKAANAVADQRDVLAETANEVVDQSNQLMRILMENDVELSEFNKVILADIEAKLQSLNKQLDAIEKKYDT